MVTAKLRIVNYAEHSDILHKLELQSAACTIKVLSNMELMKDKTFLSDLMNKNDLIGSRMLQAAISRAEEMWGSHEAKKEILTERLLQLQKELKATDDRRDIFKINKKISRYKADSHRGVTIGGRKKLQTLGHLSNLYAIGECTEYELEEARALYSQSRNLGWVNEGEAAQKGNRHLDLSDIASGFVILKITSKMHIKLEVSLPKGRKGRQLVKACRMGIDGKLSLKSVIKEGVLYLSYDNQAVEGFAFNKKKWSSDLKKIDKENKVERAACTRQWHQECDSRKLTDKIETRVLSLDLNPERIGYAVMDLDLTNGYRVITHGCLEYRGLIESVKSKRISSGAKKHSLSLIVKRLFAIAQHYNCSRLAIEDLDFKHEVFNRRSRKFNRLTKNLWDRTYLDQLMNRWCEDLGIIREKIPPQYSSFIGNILFPYYDPTAAACEIGRRCLSWLWSRDNGKETLPSPLIWTPTLRKENLPDSMLDVPESALSSVNKAFRWVSNAGLRYRTSKRMAYGHRLTHRTCLWEGTSCYV